MITIERLRYLVKYSKTTGVLTSAVDRHLCPVGKILGYPTSTGYRRVVLDYEEYLIHRLAWFYVTGAWPAQHIDHIDGVRDNNRWRNLRDVSCLANSQNKRGVGVTQYGRSPGFIARIGHDNRVHYLGTYPTKEAAQLAYLRAKKRLHTAK